MQCNVCGKKKATVHLTEIVDDQMTEMHLCEDCAKEKSMQMEQQFGLADLLAGLSDFGKQVKETDKTKLECTNCHMTYDDFRKLGRLGCSECYESFRANLAILLKKIHGSNRHIGKAPLNMPEEKKETGDNTLQELREQLQNAVNLEDFEKAAQLRDKIHELEKQGNE